MYIEKGGNPRDPSIHELKAQRTEVGFHCSSWNTRHARFGGGKCRSD